MSDLIPWLAPWSGRVAVVLGIMIGVAIWLLLMRRPALASPRCRRCRYDLRNLPHETCPECGWVPARPIDPFRGRRRWRLALIGLLIAAALPAYTVHRRVEQYGWHYYMRIAPFYWIDPYATLESIAVDGVHFRVEVDRRPQNYARRLWVRDRDGRRIIPPNFGELKTGWRQNIRTRDKPARLTADAHHVAIAHWSGGNVCCLETLWFEIKDGRATFIASIQHRHESLIINDKDGDGIDEVMIDDDALWRFLSTVADWGPQPELILRWDGERFVLAQDLMVRGRGDTGRMISTADELRAAWRLWLNEDAQHTVPFEVAATLTAYVYTGRAEEGFALIRETWPENGPELASFESRCAAMLQQSTWLASASEVAIPR